MGLDQYLYKRKVQWDELHAIPVELKEEIAYWRKHNRLEGYMSNLYFKRGQFSSDYTHAETIDDLYDEDNKDEDDKWAKAEFNCVRLYLDESDLQNLEKAVLNKQLPEAEGFFFGGDSYNMSEEDLKELIEEDIDAISKAKQALSEGYEIFYTSWW